MYNNFNLLFTIQTHFDQNLIQKRQFWELKKKNANDIFIVNLI